LVVLRVILFLAAGASAVAQFLQERHRLKVISELPGPRARDYYERSRARDEGFLIALTLALVVAAGVALAVTFGGSGASPAVDGR
jgi:hypothetical protein